MDLGSMTEQWARLTPDKTAIRIDDVDITYKKLDALCSSAAASLGDLGVGMGDRVGILGSNSLEWCVMTLASFKLGAIVVPLNLRLSAVELGEMVEHAGCAVVAFDGRFQSAVDQIVSAPDATVVTICLDGAGTSDSSFADLVALPRTCVSRGSSDDAPAIIAYSSGTTGRPKGIVLTHGSVWAQTWQRAYPNGLTSETRTLLCVPLAFTGGIVLNFLLTCALGGTLYLEREYNPPRVLRLLVEEKITMFAGVPVMWQGVTVLDGFADADLSSLTTTVTGGAPVPVELLKTFQAKGVVLVQAYGQTEAGGFISQNPRRFAVERPSSCGFADLGKELQIHDEAGQPVPVGTVGEIVVRGAGMMTEYWQDPETTAAAFRDGWLRTGDMGRLDDEGLLYVVDRLKDLVISGGLNVYPAEVERVADDFPSVLESAAFGVADARWGEAIALVVRGEGIAIDQLLEHCRSRLGDYKVPRYIFKIDEELPRSMSGKILRRELRDRYRDQATPQNAVR